MSASKDPAVLFYISTWLTSTAEMDADTKGWYLNLILHNYDKGSLPNDIEKLAVLAGVKHSEWNRFEHVFEQVLKHKFERTCEGRMSNKKTDEILRSREDFKEKRSHAGKVGYMMKYFAKHYTKKYRDLACRNFVKDNFDFSFDLKDEHLLKQMLEHLLKLYINRSKNKSESNNEIEDEKIDISEAGDILRQHVEMWVEHRKQIKKPIASQMQFDNWLKLLRKYAEGSTNNAKEIIEISVANGWQGIFDLPTSKAKNTAADQKVTVADFFRDTIRAEVPGREVEWSEQKQLPK